MLAIFNTLKLKPADVLFRSVDGFAPFIHYGCYAGVDRFGRVWVFEHCEDSGSRLVLYENFAKGYKVFYERTQDSGRSGAIKRMRDLLDNPRQYDYLGFNCEHAKNLITKGNAYSLQVLIVLGLVGAGIYMGVKNA